MAQWWRTEISQIVSELSTDLDKGLTSEQVEQKRQQFGPNQLTEHKGPSALEIFTDQFKDFIIWVLVGAAIVSGLLKEWVDAIAIIAIVVLNSILGFIQEYRAEKSLAALKKLSSPTSKTIRGGKPMNIPSSELVPGDIIELEAGDNVPADCRIAWITSNFSVAEASLTGESSPVQKTSFCLPEEEIPLAERANMVYAGTSVVSGRAKAIVVLTGMKTELGKIAGMIQDIKKETTPLQKKLEEFGKWIVYLCFILVAAVFLLEWLRSGKLTIDIFLTAVSLAVAAIPEGLPAVVTIALAIGVQRMVARHAIIRKLPAVEALGCATVICSDKTGTLTKNEMTVQAIYADDKIFKITGIGYAPDGEFLADDKKINPADFPGLLNVLNIGVLCNGAKLINGKGTYKIFGDPTEGSLLTAAAKAGIDRTAAEKEFEFVDEIPFDSNRKKMSVIRKAGGKMIAYIKGAPDIVLNDCVGLTQDDKAKILKANDNLTDLAMRVLAVAYKDIDNIDKSQFSSDTIEKDLTFAGLIAMIDPPRIEAKQAVAECHSAGIKTVMITGDHKNTAVAIAKELKIFGPDSMALTGDELDKLTDEQLQSQIERIPVYARVAPEHKLRIVRAWRSRNEIAVMTGDGVNDAPAVKEADIGVAMGITGTDVTKEVSDMIVTDDNFASIVNAVEEGRGIYDNIRKFIHYLLSCNAGEILVMFTASLVGMPVPLLPIHILWINLVTDGLPALALGIDPIDKDIMTRPPRPTDESVITKPLAFTMLMQGAFIAACSLLAFCFIYYVEKEGVDSARSAAFIVLACSQLFHSFNCRNNKVSLFKIGIFTNKNLIAAAGFSFLLQMMVIYTPFFQKVFKTVPLGVFDWVMVVVISSFPLWAMEIVKFLRKNK
ncbi:MAG: cation-translocating P-type ATPase [Planctomycetaceae bacterium]|nr:cation-translocating P-type ATPase [Planctomycetaceae bacterium]